MSLESWKAEFYPTKANSIEAMADPIGHSLRKWEGALKKNLRKHCVSFADHYVYKEGEGIPFAFTGWNCALCERFYDEDELNTESCEECPIVELTGDDCLDAFSQSADIPMPMIRLLRKVKKLNEEKK